MAKPRRKRSGDKITKRTDVTIRTYRIANGESYRFMWDDKDFGYGNLHVQHTSKPKEVEAYGGNEHAIYRDKDVSIIISPKRLLIRTNFSRLAKGMFAYEYIYEADGRKAFVRNVARHIPMSKEEAFELALLGKLVDVNEDRALLIAKDAYDFINEKRLVKGFHRKMKEYGTEHLYVD